MQSLTIMPRRDTNENWIRIDPIPKDKEICVVYPTSSSYSTLYKIGNGCSRYSYLPFVSLEKALEEGLIYADDKVIKLKGFVNQVEEKEESNEQVYCPTEFVW